MSLRLDQLRGIGSPKIPKRPTPITLLFSLILPNSISSHQATHLLSRFLYVVTNVLRSKEWEKHQMELWVRDQGSNPSSYLIFAR
ncbi:hypothetical protein L218DRAFT_409531 [Marasmius fiardii PR-910]|nr:hypothetical protein L218DRAFT_409531 [Marasmius fiardii PR-910]